MPGFDTNRFTDLNENLTKHLICSICLNIFDNAVRSKCEHTFCKSCVKQWIESNNKECPECRKPFKTRKRSNTTECTENVVLIGNHIFKSNLMANNMINELMIKCKYDFNGCQQSVKLESLLSHMKVCPHRFCSKCDFTFDEDIEHNSVNCIELLKNDRNDLKERYELCSQLITQYKNQIGFHTDINNKLEEENNELKSKLKSFEELLQNKTNNKTTVDREVANNEYICDSIENIYFGTFKTTIDSLEVHQDQFIFNSLVTNKSNQ